MSDKKIIKIKKSSRSSNSAKKNIKIPALGKVKAGLSEWVLENSITGALQQVRAGLSNSMDYIDTTFIVNNDSDYDLNEKVLSKFREAGYDIELVNKTHQPVKLPDGKEFTRVFLVNRYHLKDRKNLNASETSQALQSFKRIKNILGDNAA